MIAKRLPRRRDPVRLGKLTGDILTGQVEDRAPDHPEDATKNQVAVALVRKGMGNRRMTRLTNAFSKNAANHAQVIAIYFMHYNFVHLH